MGLTERYLGIVVTCLCSAWTRRILRHCQRCSIGVFGNRLSGKKIIECYTLFQSADIFL